MPLPQKRKSSPIELDLDADFAALTSTVNASAPWKASSQTKKRASRTPTRVKHQNRTPTQESLSQSASQKGRDRDLLDLCATTDLEGPSLGEPSKLHPYSGPRPQTQPITPTHVSQTAQGDVQTELDALIDGVNWDDMDYVLTPSTSHSRRPKTPISSHKTPTRRNTLSTPRASGSYSSKQRRLNLTKSTPRTQKRELEQLCDGMDEWSDAWEPSDDEVYTIDNKPLPAPAFVKPPQVRDTALRCVVENVDEVVRNGRAEKHLSLREDSKSARRKAILKDDWTLTNVRRGDIVNIIGDFDAANEDTVPTMVISSVRNTIILHPDLLVSATSVSTGSSCARRPLLSSLLRSTTEITPSTVWGDMLHRVMQSCLASNKWNHEFLEEQINNIVRAQLDRLVRIGTGIESARVELRSRAMGLPQFSKKYMGDKPKADAFLTDTHSAPGSRARLALTGLNDIEETIWSPTYGLKGVVDASMEGRVIEEDGTRKEDRNWTFPFEIKTGLVGFGIEHRAQTMLYSLLIAERYGVDVPSGLLYYTQSEEVIRVRASRNELRGLIIGRNEIASWQMARGSVTPLKPNDKSTVDNDLSSKSLGSRRPFLPPTIDDNWNCKKCYSVDGCMLYRRAVEEVVDFSSPIADLYQQKTSHLTARHASFFKQWEALLALEEQDMNRFRKELWTMTAPAREKVGRCFANMIVANYSVVPMEDAQGTMASRRHIYEFIRAPSMTSFDDSSSFLNGHMVKGDVVIVSIEPNLLAYSYGFIRELHSTRVVIALDRELTPAVLNRGHHPSSSVRTIDNSPMFRIDRDELTTGLGRIRDNLAQLFYVKGDARRRSLVVDLESPTFDERLAPSDDEMPAVLNVSQKAAMRKVMCAKDYTLIHGMPGTGKTTTIAEIIKALVADGKTVLLASYTHSAVDTILLKLADSDIDILRLGNVEKIHPDVFRHTLAAQPQAGSLEQLERRLLAPPVVATTCLSIDHALFSRRRFDVCIVDEASQVTLPTCLGPLRFADRFVLVGDHHQLPPLVRSRDARKGGLESSLFRVLCDSHPEAVIDLTYQYRMNEDILFLSNTLVYKNRLQCGTQAVAERSLTIPNLEPLYELHHDNVGCDEKSCWIEKVLDPSCKAVFLDTTELSVRESRVGDLVQNETEARLVAQIVEAMCRCGVEESEIGVISLYRQQNKLLGHFLQDRQSVEILTADRSQGRDKDCIIVSMVRSNEEGNIGDLLKDWRRINVALTRARAKLIIIGSRSTLRIEPLLAKMIALMSERNWIHDLPHGADKLHDSLEPTVTSSGRNDRSPNSRNRGKVDGGVLRGRDLLRDVVNDLS